MGVVPLAGGPVVIYCGHLKRDGSGNQLAVAFSVGEKGAGLLVLDLVLVIHVGENLKGRLRKMMTAQAGRRDDPDDRQRHGEEEIAQLHSSSPM